MMIQRRKNRRLPARLRLEALEDRLAPSVSVVANFENSAALANYRTVFHYYPSADLAAAAAHDGLQGLDKHDGYEWMVGTDPAEQVHQGETISVWIKLAGAADGRAYLGFGTTAPSLTQDTSAFKTLALVLAPNTNQLLLQSISGNGGFTTLTGASAAQTYQADHWYRAEVAWGTGGAITGKLYDSDGTTLLSTVSGSSTLVTSGGIGIRAFGSDKYFDTYVVDSDSTATPAQLANAGGGLDPSWVYQTPPPAPTNGPSGGAVPLPWAYTNYTGPGPVREIQLDEWDSLAQFGSVTGGQVVIAGTNTSHNIGTGPNAAGVDWGPSLRSAGGPATPQLAQYILRMLPGDQTRLISTSSVKHFFAPSILNPGQTDAYGSGLNAEPSYFTYGSELNPVTGELVRPSDIGPVDVNGINQNTLPVPSQIAVAPHVAVADLDPAQNPAGTRWFALANVYVEGEQDVTKASRWVEFVPHYNGTTFTFTYPNGSTGQLNFRTIPNLAQPAAGPYVASSTPNGNTFGPVNHVRVTFDRAVDASTFTLSSVDSFTRRVGTNPVDLSGSLLAVTPVGTDGKTFDISFQGQTAPGTYSLTIGPNILDLSGNPMDQNQNGVAGEDPADDFTATFTIQGPSILSATPTGAGFAAVDHVHVTFNEPIDPTSFGTGSVTAFTRTVGTAVTDLSSALVSVTPTDASDTQFDITFASQSSLGAYSLTIGTGVLDQAGNPTTAPFTDNFSINGPKITAATPTGNANAPNPTRTVRVTFNEPVDPATFTPAQVTVAGPNGAIAVTAVNPVAGSGNTQFDVVFPQVATGFYTVTVGPDVRDFAGHQMDQNGNFIPGEPDDAYVLQFGVTGLKINSATPNGTQAGQAYGLRVTFNEPIDLARSLRGEFSLTGPDGSHRAIGVAPVAGSGYTQFDILFAPLTASGTYTVVLGPHVYDVYGNAMDQNGNLIPGEPGDAYTTTFALSGPGVSSLTPPSGRPIDHVTVTFDRPIDPATVSAASFTMTGPGGVNLAVSGAAEVPYTNDTQYEVDFAPSSATGTYVLTVHAGVADFYGNALAADVTSSFGIQVGYTAAATTFQPIELFGQAGTQTLTFTSGQVTADDDVGTINLGSNTFNFYGTAYSQLYVSSNGLITFGSGNTAYTPTNLAGNPAQAAIAAYWTDLIKTGTEPMILYQISGNQLIIEWYNVTTYPSGSSDPMTFQAILQLNTSGVSGDIVLNYDSVTGVGASDDSSGITVGVKDAGTGSTVSHTVVQDGSGGGHGDPRIASGHAIRLSGN